ncbi:hypothetical protein ABB37_03541 [Leptomonas pyrrhocoris]|uniref:Uncharacterized protein n=1 Tax=Leptomonas pyrrhocoris TaxID=157538 RepID=A0A0N0DX76_LEPPY|nr:hypothetical protein ABB37_03541 [Leptomonas pyrrhocoris]KPA82482.1 hypothetical protein ABB37_03541 [Leptomonas pyrrhocoris]|eukprot:XP_015660921.1 hypothetical protein ABB37_03541 [Leptomonas pyrrhocoris]
MSHKTTTSAGALLQRRNVWVASLKANLPQFTDSTASPLQNSRRTTVFGQGERRLLDDAVGTSLLLLPSGWKEQATRRLARTLHGVVEPPLLRQTDYFLCSLIHPTYVQAATIQCEGEAKQRKLQQQLRRTVCMPLELTMAGSKSLRLMHEVNGFASAGSKTTASARLTTGASSSFQLDAPWPELKMADTRAFLASFRESELESLVLYDKKVFSPTPSAPSAEKCAVTPSEVSLAAFTALCGSIELVCGWASLVHYLDRVAREHGRIRT